MHGPKWPFLLAHGPGVVVVNCWARFCTLGRALRTKETLPDFCELCRVTRHPRVFRRLTGCQRTPGKWGVTFRVTREILMSTATTPPKPSPSQVVVLNKTFKLVNFHSGPQLSHSPTFFSLFPFEERSIIRKRR